MKRSCRGIRYREGRIPWCGYLFRLWGAAKARHGSGRGNGHVRSAGELAAGFEAASNSEAESLANGSGFVALRHSHGEIFHDFIREGFLLDQRQR